MSGMEVFSERTTLFESILDSTIDGVVVVDRKFKVQYINKSIERFTGLNKENVIEKHCKKLVPYLNCEEACPPKKTFRDGLSHTTENVVKTPSGDEISQLVSSSPLLDGNGKVVGCVEIIKNITERKKSEEMLQEEKNKLQAIIEAMEYGLTIQDHDYNIIYQNEILKKIFGHLGEKCYRVYEGKDRICDGCPVEMAFKDGKSHTSERRVTMPSGEIAYWENTANPIRNAKGEIVACLEIARNITNRKKAEEKLTESQEFLKGIIENSGDAIVTTDREGKITLWSRGAEELYGYRSEEVLGKGVDFLYPEELKEERKKWQKAILAGETVRNIRTRIYNSDGELVNINLTLSPMLDEDGNPIGTVGVSKDITNVIKAEKQLHEKIEELEKWQRLTVHREVKMVELKKEIKELKERLKRYGETF